MIPGNDSHLPFLFSNLLRPLTKIMIILYFRVSAIHYFTKIGFPYFFLNPGLCFSFFYGKERKLMLISFIIAIKRLEKANGNVEGTISRVPY